MVTEERKQEISAKARAWVAEQTCSKAHRFTVGSCIACERDELTEAIKSALDSLEACEVGHAERQLRTALAKVKS